MFHNSNSKSPVWASIVRLVGFGGLILVIVANWSWHEQHERHIKSIENRTESLEEEIEPSYVIPDPCGLETVVCEDEWSAPVKRAVTAYTSDPAETDSTPCKSANGMNICHMATEITMRLCAANFVPFGTTLRLQDGNDEFMCLVVDRTNKKYADRVDLYFGMDKQAAISWGVRAMDVSVIKEN